MAHEQGRKGTGLKCYLPLPFDGCAICIIFALLQFVLSSNSDYLAGHLKNVIKTCVNGNISSNCLQYEGNLQLALSCKGTTVKQGFVMALLELHFSFLCEKSLEMLTAFIQSRGLS